MKTVNVYKAQPIGPENAESITIVIDEPLPDLPSLNDSEGTLDDWLATHAERFHTQAETIADALINSLPQGTTDRLIGILLLRKASHFVIKWTDK